MFVFVLLIMYYFVSILVLQKRKLVALLLLSYRCIVTINILWSAVCDCGISRAYSVIFCQYKTD